jgi:uncharacterized protein
MENVKLMAANELPVTLRINVDRTNLNRQEELLDILEANELKDIKVYLGLVTDETSGCEPMESVCATTEEYSRANWEFRETLRRRGFKWGQEPYYPRIAFSCLANRANSYVIDPDGDICLCWHEIGDKAKVIGNIITFDQPRAKNQKLHEIRWLTWEPFDYPECAECQILPICMAGCGYQAMFVKGRPQCLEWKYDVEKYLLARYKLEKNKQATG